MDVEEEFLNKGGKSWGVEIDISLIQAGSLMKNPSK